MTAYDKLDWHYDAAVSAGQPPGNAFTHIGFYLAWLIRHDLHNPEIFPASHVAAVKRGEMTGSDLADDIDTKLHAVDMNAEGRAFSDACYRTYLEEYTTAFDGEPDYSVVDDPANYARAAAVLDRLYAAWVADGRPKPAAEAPFDLPTAGQTPTMSFELPADMPREAREALEAIMEAGKAGGFRIDSPMEFTSSVAPELEALVPRDIAGSPFRIDSATAKAWSSSILNRALRRLNVAPSDATVVAVLAGDGPGLLTITLYGVPGIAADRLHAEFEAVIVKAPGAKWEARQLHDRAVSWATGSLFTVAYWARDGLVVHLAGRAEDVERAIPRLP